MRISDRSSSPVRSLVAVTGVVTGASLPAFLTGGLGVQIRGEMGFGEAGLGLAFGTAFGAAAVSSAVLGRLAERLGAAPSMRISGFASAAVLLAIAAAARSFPILLLLLIGAGATNALAQPAANLFIARTVPSRRLGTAFAVKQSGIPAAALLGGLAVPVFALTLGWRWAFAAAAVVPALAALILPVAAAADPAPDETPPRRPPVLLPPLLVLGAGIGLGAAAAGALGAFLVNSAVAVGIGEGQAGLLVSGGSAVGIAVRLLAGTRADRRSGGHLRVVTLMLLLGACAYGLLATGDPLLLVLATPVAFGAGWGWPGLFNLAVVRHHREAAATASGITQTGTYLGALLGPLMFGAIVERASYGAAWAGAALLAVAGAAAISVGRQLLLREKAGLEAGPATTPL